jgi:hypothetical protein
VEFLEETPPNTAVAIFGLGRPVRVAGTVAKWEIDTPELRLYCSRDDGERRFATDFKAITIGRERYQFLKYTCRDCQDEVHSIAVVIQCNVLGDGDGDVEVLKLGQFPPFGSRVPRRIAKLLGDDLELYQKGKRAEAQGLGIGAAAYFRRIVENQWQQLVRELRESASRLGAADLSAYDSALRDNQFKKAVALLKDALPQRLLVQGQNPLTLLHGALSTELHNLSDEECVEVAGDIRRVLEAMLENIV